MVARKQSARQKPESHDPVQDPLSYVTARQTGEEIVEAAIRGLRGDLQEIKLTFNA